MNAPPVNVPYAERRVLSPLEQGKNQFFSKWCLIAFVFFGFSFYRTITYGSENLTIILFSYETVLTGWVDMLVCRDLHAWLRCMEAPICWTSPTCKCCMMRLVCSVGSKMRRDKLQRQPSSLETPRISPIKRRRRRRLSELSASWTTLSQTQTTRTRFKSSSRKLRLGDSPTFTSSAARTGAALEPLMFTQQTSGFLFPKFRLGHPEKH